MTIDYELLARRVTKWMKQHPTANINSDWICFTDDMAMLLRDIHPYYKRRVTLMRGELVRALRLAAFRGWLKYER